MQLMLNQEKPGAFYTVQIGLCAFEWHVDAYWQGTV